MYLNLSIGISPLALAAAGDPTVPDQTAYFGDGTASGAGGFQPVRSGVYIPLQSYDGVDSGDITGFTPSISSGRLVFSAAGAPDGAVLLVTPVGYPQMKVTISEVAGEKDVASMTELSAAISAYGDTIVPRPSTDFDGTISVTPTGTYTGANPVLITARSGQGTSMVQTDTFNLASGDGIKIDGLEFTISSDGNTSTGLPYAFEIFGDNFTASNCTFAGAVDVVEGASVGQRRVVDIQATGATISDCLIYNHDRGIRAEGENNTIERCTFRDGWNDDIFLSGRYKGATIKDNFFGRYIRQLESQNVTSVTVGNPTVITVSGASSVQDSESVVLRNLGGLDSICDLELEVDSHTATTITIDVDSTGLTYTSGGTCEILLGSHKDCVQFRPQEGDTPAADDQDNVLVEGNVFSPEAGSSTVWATPQFLYGGSPTTGTATRSGWIIRGNLAFMGAIHGINCSTDSDAIVRNNTIVRLLGQERASHAATPTITTTTGSTVQDNVACSYSGETGDNNYTVSLTDGDAVPANSADIALYEALFDGPIKDGEYYTKAEAIAALTEKSGGALDTATPKQGAAAAYDFDTGTFTDLRAAGVDFAPYIASPESGATVGFTAGTGTDMTVSLELTVGSLDTQWITEAADNRIYVLTDGRVGLRLEDDLNATVVNTSYTPSSGVLAINDDIVITLTCTATSYVLEISVNGGATEELANVTITAVTGWTHFDRINGRNTSGAESGTFEMRDVTVTDGSRDVFTWPGNAAAWNALGGMLGSVTDA